MFSPYTYRHMKPSTTKFVQSNFRTSKFWTDVFLFLVAWSVWLHCQDFVQDIWIINDYLNSGCFLFYFGQSSFQLALNNSRKTQWSIQISFMVISTTVNPSWFELTAFTHFLRGIIADSEETTKASANSLGRHGFINYFGLQVLLW